MKGARPRARRPAAAVVVVVGHCGRLGRVSTGLAGAALRAVGRRLVVVGDGGISGGLVRDVVEVPALFCARVYGRRPARTRALKVVGPAAVMEGGQCG